MKSKPVHPLRKWRQQNNITLAALSKKSKVGKSHISEIETYKKRASLNSAFALSKASGLPMEIFVR